MKICLIYVFTNTTDFNCCFILFRILVNGMRLALKNIRIEVLEVRNFTLFSLHQNDRTCQSFSYSTPYNVLKDPFHILDLIKNLPLIFEILLTLLKIFSFVFLALLGSLFTTKLIFKPFNCFD